MSVASGRALTAICFGSTLPWKVSLALSSPRGNERPKARPEAARQPLLTSEAVEQPNTNPVGRCAAVYRTRQLAGLILEAPGEFQNTPLNLGPAQEFMESSEMQVFHTAGFEIAVQRTVYKSGLELSFDGAAQGAVDGIARLDGIRELRHTATELTVSGKPARRLSVTAGRWRKTLRVELLLIADGQTYFQVHAIFDAANPHGTADAERLLQSVSLAP